MKNPILNRTAEALRGVLVAVGIIYLVTYLVVVWFRIRYPFALEWLEGSLVIDVERILSGQKLYVPPSLDFIHFFYTPLYFYVSAAVAYFTGVGFLPLRLVAFVSSLGCFLFIFLSVRRETGSAFAAFLATGLFAATYRISGDWLDIARVDSLFLFFLLAGFYAVKFGKSAISCILAGTLFSLSFLTKQTALAIAIPVMLYYIVVNRRNFVLFVVTMAVIVGGSTLVLNRIHAGWYTYYVFGVPSGHPLIGRMLIEFWTADILAPLSIACSLSVLYFVSRLSDSRKEDCFFYLLMAGGMVGAAWMSRIHEGGFDNVLLTAYAAISILFGLGLHCVLEALQSGKTEKGRYFEVGAYLVCLLQFILLVYNPLLLIPTEEDVEAGWKLVERIKQVEGDVFVPYHPYLPVLAGKRTFAHGEALYSIMSSDREKGRAKLDSEINRAVREKRFSAVILDMHRSRKIWNRGVGPANFRGYCFDERPIFNDADVFWPITGVKVRPEIFMRLCPPGR